MKDYEQEHIVVTKKNVTKVKAAEGYDQEIGTLCKVIDNGNGYTVKFPSYSSVYPPIYMNIDYAQAEYLWLAFGHILGEDK